MNMNYLRDLTVQELRDLFLFMDNTDMQNIVDALRALAGDTESLKKLQQLHISIDQGIERLMILARKGDKNFIDYDPESRYFKPVNGFIDGKRFVEIRIVNALNNAGKELETLIHYHSGMIKISTDEYFSFLEIDKRVKSGSWEEVHHTMLNDITDPELEG